MLVRYARARPAFTSMPAASAAAPQVPALLTRPPLLLRTGIPTSIRTPVRLSVFASLVAAYPGVRMRDFALHGLRHGFDIGLRGLAGPTRPCNLRSARDNPAAVSATVTL